MWTCGLAELFSITSRHQGLLHPSVQPPLFSSSFILPPSHRPPAYLSSISVFSCINDACTVSGNTVHLFSLLPFSRFSILDSSSPQNILSRGSLIQAYTVSAASLRTFGASRTTDPYRQPSTFLQHIDPGLLFLHCHRLDLCRVGSILIDQIFVSDSCFLDSHHLPSINSWQSRNTNSPSTRLDSTRHPRTGFDSKFSTLEFRRRQINCSSLDD